MFESLFSYLEKEHFVKKEMYKGESSIYIQYPVFQTNEFKSDLNTLCKIKKVGGGDVTQIINK